MQRTPSLERAGSWSQPDHNHKTEAPSSSDDGDGAGVPALDAIRGNRLEIWGVEGVPRVRSLRTCIDGGAELQLQAADEAPQSAVEPLQDLDTLFVGERFGPDGVGPHPSTISESDTVDHVKSDGAVEKMVAREKLIAMEKELRKASCKPFGTPHTHYIPSDALRSIMTYEAIRTVLPCITPKDDAAPSQTGTPDTLARVILGGSDGGQKPGKSFYKILAILVLMGKPASIREFVQADITDTNLPLHVQGEGRPSELYLEGQTKPISLFKGWLGREVESFERGQWETLAPFFSRGTEKDDYTRRYKLESSHPLPFEVIPEEPRVAPTKSVGSMNGLSGGHGKVWKVKIARAHHNLPSYRGMESNPALAIKRLLADDREDFKNEVGILTRLNKCKDPHLVKLLLTIEIPGSPGGQDSTFYLLFPLADGNLRDFWRDRFPHPQDVSMAQHARWVARQFDGLAWALCKLHDLHEQEARGAGRDESSNSSSSSSPFYGIHGDIKPENLLWYRDWVGPSWGGGAAATQDKAEKDPLGVLQLADFGISTLHHTATRSAVNLRRATKTYAAPEVEWGLNDCSRSFDIWSLGCVFLEFICWLVLGGCSGAYNPVDTFQEARYLDRKNKSMWGSIQDAFYIVEVNREGLTEFKVNPAVDKLIKTLRDAPACSDFVSDILDIIANDMLVVEPRKTSMQQLQTARSDSGREAPSDGQYRVSCLTLAHKLRDILGKGQDNDDYFAKAQGMVAR